MGKEFTKEDGALLDDLGVVVEPEKAANRTPREERIVAGFEEIQRFVDTHGRAPHHSDSSDIFERLYAIRLDRLREQDDCCTLLFPFDRQGLLSQGSEAESPSLDEMDDDELLAELGVEAGAPDIAELRHVRSSAEKHAAEEVATRRKCQDFKTFRPLFEQVQRELDTGIREAMRFRDHATIDLGQFFILGGQKAYVAEKENEFRNAQGRIDARLRVVFDNGTESNMLMRSLERALQKDQAGRRILETSLGPLFDDVNDNEPAASGTIYVLRSKADIPFIAENRSTIHKIGVTTGKVEKRIAGAQTDPTFLLADVEIVATYTLHEINPIKLEQLLHHFFSSARLNVEIEDRFGNPVVPREWFLVPLDAIDGAVDKIQKQTIAQYEYDRKSASLVARK